MNTKGTKFLAVLAVLALAFAAFAIIMDESDATALGDKHADKWSAAVQGPLDFAAVDTSGLAADDVSNAALGNNVLVTYDAVNKTYKVTGTLNKNAATDNAAFDALGPAEGCTYGLVFGMTITDVNTVRVVGNLDLSWDFSGDSGDEVWLMYIKDNKGFVVYIDDVKYTVDTSAVALASSHSAAVGYTALANANALEGLTDASDVSGTDAAGGSWSFVGATNTLTLNNYKGSEIFVSTVDENMIINLVGTNTITAYAYADGYALGIIDHQITIQAGDTASLAINYVKAADAPANQNTIGGIGDGKVFVVGNGATKRIALTINAPWAAMYPYGGLDLTYADLTVSSGEKAINTKVITMVGSTITAKLSDEFYNKLGTDERFGVRADSLTLDENSTIATQGLCIKKDQAAVGGRVTVSGGYDQPASTAIAGLQYKGTTALTVYSYAKDGAVIIVDSASNVKGLVNVMSDSTTKAQEVIEAASAAAIKDKVEDSQAADVINASVTAAITLDVSVVPEKTLMMTTSGEGAISGTIKFSDDVKNVITLTSVKGTLTITKGSIRIEAAPWSEGSITLADDDEVKIYGTITGADTIIYTGSKTPKIIVEKDEILTITGSLVIPAGAVFEVYGKVTGTGALTLNGNMNVYDGGEVTLTTINANKPIVAKEGSTIAGAVTFGGGKITAESGSDINRVTTANPEKLEGKDSASGTWSYDVTGATNVLKLNGYNGTYNFTAFAPAIKKIDLTGTNSISYVLPAEFDINNTVLFGGANLTSITTATSGNLAIAIDVSKVAGAELDDNLTVISAGALSIDGVNVSIAVSGTNNEWLATETSAMAVKGIAATSIDAYQADLDVDVLSSYTAAGVVAIDATQAVQFRSCADIAIASAGIGIVATDAGEPDGLVIKATNLTITAKKLGVFTGALVLSNGADLTTESGVVATGNVTVSQESILFVEGFNFTGAKLTNDGKIVLAGNNVLGDAVADVIENNAEMSVTDNIIILGAVTNNDSFVNTGAIGLYGTFANTKTFDNYGSFTVLAKEYNTAGITPLAPLADAITFTDAAAAAGKVKITAINVTEIVPNANGSANIKATVTLAPATVIKDEIFAGIFAPSQSGTGYTLTLANQTASISVTYSEVTAGTPEVGSNFTASVSGYVVANDDSAVYLDSYTVETTTPAADGADVADATFLAKVVASGAEFTTTAAGKVTNAGEFTIYSPATAAIGGEFEGNILVNVATALNIGGKFTGNIVSEGTAVVSVSKKMVGDITAAGNVATTVDLEGDIISGGDVAISGKFTGDVTMKTADKTFSVMGTADGTLTFTAEYKATKDATTKTASSASVEFATVGTTGAVSIVTVAGADATAETAMKDVSLKFGTIVALGTDKTASITAVGGIFAVPENKALVAGYEFVIEAGATIEVAKAAQLDVTNSALKVSKDAVKNYETGTAPAVTYGKVVSIMSFDIDGGAYTIYSNVAYALSNCDEGDISVLTSDTINESVVVKKGVNVIVGEGVTLTFAGKNVSMDTGAKITLQGTGKVVFNATGDNKPVDEETEYVYYTVSGTIAFGENVITFEGVRFSAAATIQGVAAVDPAPAKISATLPFNQGTATLASGVGVGAITVGNAAYPLVKADDVPNPVKNTLFSGTFVIADGATFEATSITDSFGNVTIDADGKKVKETNAYASKVTVNGILKVNNSITIKGVYDGTGKIVLAAGKSVTVAASDAKVADTARNIEPIVTAEIVDTTDAENGYALDAVSPAITKTLVLSAKKVGAVDTVTIEGEYDVGTIDALTIAQFNGLKVLKGATFVADTVNVNVASDSTGILKAITMNKRAEGVTEFAVLNYEVTYVDGSYTVYTALGTADLETISNVVVEKDGFEFPAKLEGTATITIEEGVTAHISRNTAIGTPITSLGADLVIKGTIMIDDDKFVIIYPNVDISGAKFVKYAEGDSIVKSVYDIEGVTYATVYANKVNTHAGDVQLDDAAALMNPQIKGYTFTCWNAYNEEGMNQDIGVCNVTAALVAQKVTVKATFLEGVQYYCNGVLYDAVGIDAKVTVGSIFTAKIVDYSKYQGTPLVNGQNAFEVTEDATLTVTGVSPVEPEPAPAPAGMSLTEILLIVLVVLIAIMVVIIALRLNRS